jgi:hypothetical protein
MVEPTNQHWKDCPARRGRECDGGHCGEPEPTKEEWALGNEYGGGTDNDMQLPLDVAVLRTRAVAKATEVKDARIELLERRLALATSTPRISDTELTRLSPPIIEWLRDNFRRDGAEGESVHKACELLEAAIRRIATIETHEHAFSVVERLLREADVYRVVLPEKATVARTGGGGEVPAYATRDSLHAAYLALKGGDANAGDHVAK